MNVTLRPGLTKQEFLEWEEHQELRHEFDGQKVIPMVGATQAHELIVANIIFSMKLRLRGGPCRVFGSGMKIEAAGSIRYPDAAVACGPVQPQDMLLANPLIVFEVESRSTALVDQTIKNPEYEATPSIMRYVTLSQNSIAANVYARVDGVWTGSLLTDPAKPLPLPEIGVEVPLDEFYEGVLPAPDSARRSRYRRR